MLLDHDLVSIVDQVVDRQRASARQLQYSHSNCRKPPQLITESNRSIDRVSSRTAVVPLTP